MGSAVDFVVGQVHATAQQSAQRLEQLGVALNGSYPAPGWHDMGWNDFTHVFGFTPQRQEVISDLQLALSTAKSEGATQAWVGGSLTRLDKPVVGDADFATDLMDWQPIYDAFAAAHSVQRSGARDLIADDQVAQRINVFYRHGEGLEDEWLQFLTLDRDNEDVVRGLVHLDLSDVPEVDPASLPHTHSLERHPDAGAKSEDDITGSMMMDEW